MLQTKVVLRTGLYALQYCIKRPDVSYLRGISDVDGEISMSKRSRVVGA